MSGPIGLHGGGEYLPGDERFLDALLEAAARAADGAAAGPTGGDVAGHSVELPGRPAGTPGRVRPIRVVIVPTAAARGRPDLAAATGRAAFERRASAGDHGPIEVAIARIVDAESAADPDNVELLMTADLVHFPGGDPDLVPAVLNRSAALSALESAWQGGTVVAGASAGAMALAEWSWTPHGGIHGLGFVAGIAVVPHYDDVRRTRWQAALDAVAPGGIGYLGLDERTGVIAEPNGPTGRAWRVAGQGAAHWFARGATEAVIGRHGDLLHLPA
ncbi:MAG TPA: Type 1 glutamine amidotransferase-like domain-containing protein [Candidatus Limnocylindrales bacterium]|nr:Type 1 glutamine amidotransferase-like domain-containing protein [Candidatus Limnocylindrales bacterium]